MTLRTEVSNFEKDGEPHPPKEGGKEWTMEATEVGKPPKVEDDIRSKSQYHEYKRFHVHNQEDIDGAVAPLVGFRNPKIK